MSANSKRWKNYTNIIEMGFLAKWVERSSSSHGCVGVNAVECWDNGFVSIHYTVVDPSRSPWSQAL